jgi:general secretion pathway protein C
MGWSGAWLAQSLDVPVALEPLAVLGVNSSSAESASAEKWPSLVGLWGEPVVVKAPPPAPVSRPAPPPTPKTEVPVATRLNLKLLGVIQSSSRDVAIIGSGSKTLVLTIGEEVQANVTLLEVHPHYVILQNRQKKEILAMEGEVVVDADKKEEPEPQKAERPELDTEKLKTLSGEIRQNPMRFGHYVRFQPLQENGNWVGLRIWPRNEPQMFAALGFEQGDVIKAINGQSMDQMAKNPAIWNGFLQETRFSLQVERNGLLETVEVDLSTE